MKADSTAAQAGPVANQGRGPKAILKSYIYWTYKRGTFHYDVMVTLILLFIFVAPQLWNFGDRPSTEPAHASNHGKQRRGHGVIITWTRRCERTGRRNRQPGETRAAARN